MKLLLATPCFGGEIESDYSGAMLQTLKYLATQRIEAEVYFLKNCSSIGYARNDCASYAMRGGFDKLLFIDADQVWRPEDTALLLASEAKVVGGTYLKKQHPLRLNFNPLDAHSIKYGGRVQDPEKFLTYAEGEAAANGEVEVKHVPTGFMLIDVALLHELKEGCPTYLASNGGDEDVRSWDIFPSGVIEGRYETEDWFFCSIVREAGYKVFLQTKCVIDHIGKYTYRIPQSMRPR